MTESEEMYLVTIARLKETCGENPIPLSSLAAELDVLPVSANQMIRKLEENGLVTYQPYKGVELSPEGLRLALLTLRRRRLWEVFLVERLSCTSEEASTLACRLEHALPSEAAERLAQFLGSPQHSPNGLPIPQSDSKAEDLLDVPLAALKVGEPATISRIEADPPARAFLLNQGLYPGAQLQALAVSASGEALVATSTGISVHLAEALVKTIWTH